MTFSTYRTGVGRSRILVEVDPARSIFNILFTAAITELQADFKARAAMVRTGRTRVETRSGIEHEVAKLAQLFTLKKRGPVV